MSEPGETLQGIGVRVEGLDRIRLGRGVIGKATYIAGAAVLGLAAIALALRDPTIGLIIAFLLVIVFAGYFVGSLWFAHKHPGVALLEGAELIQWKQLDAAASDPAAVTDRAPTSPPLIEKRR